MSKSYRDSLLKAREWTKAELLAEKPRGELFFRDDDGTLYECFICHGCQTCWDMDPETMELHEAYPHVYRMDPVVEVTV